MDPKARAFCGSISEDLGNRGETKTTTTNLIHRDSQKSSGIGLKKALPKSMYPPMLIHYTYLVLITLAPRECAGAIVTRTKHGPKKQASPCVQAPYLVQIAHVPP